MTSTEIPNHDRLYNALYDAMQKEFHSNNVVTIGHSVDVEGCWHCDQQAEAAWQYFSELVNGPPPAA